ncbi:MAG: tetratricopeptide repeat protein [Minisyncoccota bacterium]
MNKKLTIYSISLLILALGFFFIFKEIYKNNSEISNTNSIPLDTATTTVDSVLVNPSVKLDCSEFKDFLNRSFIFSGNFNEETKNVYSQKIDKTIILLKENCNYFEAWIDLGLHSKSIGDFQAAKFAWETASRINPENFLPYHNLGNLYGFSLKDLSRAEEYYLKAINKNFDSLNSYSDLADLYFYNGESKRSISLLLGGLEQSMVPYSRLFFLQKIASIYEQSGDKVNALKYYQTLFSLDPTNTSVKQQIERLKAL